MQGDMYERGRSAGLSHGTAAQFADAVESGGRTERVAGPRREWAHYKPPPVPRGEPYNGEVPLIALAALLKLGNALRSNWCARRMAALELPLVESTRVRSDDCSLDGCLALDLILREIGGRQHYTTCRVPISACINHDFFWLIARVLQHLKDAHIDMIYETIVEETDVAHANGSF